MCLLLPMIVVSSGLDPSPVYADESAGPEDQAMPSGRIVYSKTVGGVSEIWSIARDGTDARRLTSGHHDVDPTWSPSGREIVFARVPPLLGDEEVYGTETNLWRMNAAAATSDV